MNSLEDKTNESVFELIEETVRRKQWIGSRMVHAPHHSRRKPLEPINCNSVLASAIDTLRKKIDAANAVVISDDLPVVMGDEAQLERLFQGLIDNAFKRRGDRSPRICISVREVEDASMDIPRLSVKKGWLFSVSDNGAGIDDPDHFDQAFQSFQRSTEGRTDGGLGSDLAVCKKIVERHGGRIWAESEPGKGAVVYFTIP